MVPQNVPAALRTGRDLTGLIRSTPPLVGRQAQLEWLEHCLREAVTGRPQLCLVAGEAGIGKTRLLRELRGVANRSGVTVCSGRAHQDLKIPYLPFEPLLSRLTREAPTTEEIRRLLPGTTVSGTPTPVQPRVEGDQGRLRAFCAVADVCFERARTGAILVVLDDLHWADGPTLDLLAHLVFAAADAAVQEPVPLMIVGSFRPGEEDDRLIRVLSRLRREEICQVLNLSGLDEGAVDQLVRSLGVADPARQLVDTVMQVSRGNPLFVQEILHHLVEHGALDKRGGSWVTTLQPSEIELPEVLPDAIAARTRALSEGCRRALTLASFLGDRFDIESLAAVNREEPEVLLSRLEEARDAHLLIGRRAGFEFPHALVRRAFYAQPSAPRREQIHRRIAETLEELHADALEEHVQEIAHHWIAAGAAGDPARLVKFARRAGDQAFDAFGWPEAARYHEATLADASSAEHLSVRERADLHYRAGLSHYRNMDPGPCLDHFDKAVDAYRSIGDTTGMGRTLLEAARTRYTLAAVPYGTLIEVGPVENILGALGEGEAALRGRLLAVLAEAYCHARRPDQGDERARAALEIGERIGDDLIRCHALLAIAWAQMQRMEVSASLETYRAALAHARRVGDPWVQGWPLQRMPVLLACLGRLDEAQEIIGEACELNRRLHDWADHSISLGNLAALAVARGRFGEVEAQTREAMKMVQRTRYPWGGVLALVAASGARRLRGAWAEAEDALDLLVEPGRVFDVPGPGAQVLAATSRLLVRAQADRADAETRQTAGNLLAALRGAGVELYTLPSFCALIEVGDLLDEPELVEGAGEVVSTAAEKGVVFSPGCEFLISRILGIVSTRAGDWDAADAHFQTAMAAAASSGATPEYGRSRLDCARMLAARGRAGDDVRALSLLAEARPIFQELGLGSFDLQAERLAASLDPHAKAAQPPPATPPRLSERDTEILRALARGQSDRQISDELMLSSDTLAAEVAELFERIGVDGRTGAAAYALAQELERSSPSHPGSERERRTYLPTPHSGRSVAILVSDIVGFTDLIGRLGDAKAQTLMHVHNQIVRSCLRTHLGHEIQHTGDGFIASFRASSSAIGCARAMQREFARHSREHRDTAIRVRIGLNAGTALAEEGRLFGAAVNAAARICAKAQGDEILVSESVRKETADTDICFAGRRSVTLKGFAEPFVLYKILCEDGEGRETAPSSS